MSETDKRTWNWMQSNGTALKVISDPKKGTIIVYNGEGQVVLEKKNLSPEQVKLIEQHFLTIVTRKKQGHIKNTCDYDPMVA